MKNPCYVYIAECENGKLYVGTTNDLNRRIKDHKLGYGGQYTKLFRVKKLLYTKEFKSKSAALKREKQLKKFSRYRKLKLANTSTGP